MFKFKFVLVAILVLLGCALAQSLQGELSEAVREKRGNNGDGFEMPPCTPINNGGSTVKPTSAATTRPTAAATTRPTTAPTSRPPTSATTRPTSAPATEKPTSAPTQRATSAPATQKPTQKATEKPTAAPTQKATVRPTSAPTQKATSAPVTQKPTNPPSTGGNYGSCDLVPTSDEPLKMLLPLYNYPDSTWDSVAAAASKIDIIAIINPSSGPGSASGPGTTYTNAMNKLNSAGVEQIGYVHTTYGTRSISDCKKEIDIYASGKFPHVVGIFFDEASNKAADIPYYRELYNYVLAKGYRHSVLNPGTSTDAGYLAISTNIVIYESAGSGLGSKTFPSFVKCASSGFSKAGYKYKFSGMAHSTSSSSMSSMISSMKNAGMGMVFVTDGAEGCCTYNKMASYFANEATAIQSANKN